MAHRDEVDAWLAGSALPGHRVVRVRPLAGGFRNDNLHLITDDGGEYVLRRYRQGNTCAVEAAVAARLAGVVPVAEVVAADPSGAVAGEPVLLSRFVPGPLLGSVLSTVDCGGARELGCAVGATLAGIGTVTFARPGFLSGANLDPDGTELTSGLDVFVERCLRGDSARAAFTAAERAGLLRRAARLAPLLDAVSGSRQLVHADFNPKNVLVARRSGRWTVTAVLDWEFALSGTPLMDVGNMLRFVDEIPEPFAAGFTSGFGDAGGFLPDDWRPLSRALDLFALADLLTRPPENPYFGRAVNLLRAEPGAL